MQNLWGMTFAEVTEELKLLELSQVNAKLLFSAMHRLNPDRLIKDKRSSPKLLTIYQEQLTLLPKIASAHVAQDQTIKLLIELCDGVQVESVLIPFRSQYRVCISTQAGCAMNCQFCFTGIMGLKRNLTAAEIVGQYRVAKSYLEQFLNRSNITLPLMFMGQGEPLHNAIHVGRVVDILKTPFGAHLSRTQITISTVGYLPGMSQLIHRDDLQWALSLHAPNNEKRNQIIPLNEKYSIADILAVFKEKQFAPNEMLVIEYLVIKDFNHSKEDAEELALLLKEHKIVINLIFFNPFPNSPFERPTDEQMQLFKNQLSELGLPAFVRKTKGDDVMAACGQLNHFNQNKKKGHSHPSV